MAENSKSRCDEIWDLLSTYADGEIGPGEAGRVEAHTAGCTSCAADLRFLQSTAVTLSGMPEVEPPVYLRDAILNATVRQPRWSDRIAAAWSRLGVRPLELGLAGATAAMLLVGVFVLRRPANTGTVVPSSDRFAVNVPTRVRQPKPDLPKDVAPKVAEPTVTPEDLGISEESLAFVQEQAGPAKKYASAIPQPAPNLQPGSHPLRLASAGPSAPRPNLVRTSEKSAPHLNPEAVEMPADMLDMMMKDSGMMDSVAKTDADHAPADTSTETTAPPTRVTAPGVRIILASNDNVGNPRAVASLAGIREDLRKSNRFSTMNSALLRSERSQLTVGLIATRF